MSAFSVYDMEIMLRSDMCCGTGESDGVAVDQVTALDAHGLPYIPGKRLKGLLREEAAIVAGDDDVDSLFGRYGSDHAGKLSFPDARLVGGEAIAAKAESSTPPISPRRISGVFTTTRSRTRIGSEGVAADHSLRTIQLVKRCDSKGQPTRFFCRIRGEGLTDGEKKAFDRAVKCLRGIGMNRSRGFGEVACSGEWVDLEIDPDAGGFKVQEGPVATVGYCIQLESGAVIQPGPDGPLDYVPGSMVQGVFAKGLCEGDPEIFENHVLRNTRFSNAYLDISDAHGNGGTPSEPVPFTFQTMKNASGEGGFPLYDAASRAADSQDGDGASAQRVPIGGYGALVDGKYLVSEPDESISFHSSRPSSPQRGQFYSMRSIDAGQSFSGTITAAPEAIAAFQDVIDRRGGRFSIGAAGSAGYGACRLSLKKPPVREPLRLKEGDRVAIRLVSDAIFVNDRGANTSDIAAFASTLSSSRALGFEFDASVGAGEGGCQAFAKSTVVGGYNAHWRLPKRQYVAFRKGSVLITAVKGDPDPVVPATAWTGLLQCEGFGELRIEKAGLPAETYSKGNHARMGDGNPGDGSASAGFDSEAVESFLCELSFIDACEKALLEACREADRSFGKLSVSKSSAMRIASLYSAVLKEPGMTPLANAFEAKAGDNFSGEKNRGLREACEGAVAVYSSIEEEYGDRLSDEQKRLLFAQFMQGYLRQMKQRYSMSEGGADE